MNLKSKTIYAEKISDIAIENSPLTFKYKSYIFNHTSSHLIKTLLHVASDNLKGLTPKYESPAGSSFKSIKEFLSLNNVSMFNKDRFIDCDIIDRTRKKVKIKCKRKY
jgi:hypothetical protein